MLPRRFKVNAIAPGSVAFPGGVSEQRRLESPAVYERTRDGSPAGRMGSPDEIAEVALFLASPRALDDGAGADGGWRAAFGRVTRR